MSMHHDIHVIKTICEWIMTYCVRALCHDILCARQTCTHTILSARLVCMRYCLAALCVMEAQTSVGSDEIVCGGMEYVG